MAIFPLGVCEATQRPSNLRVRNNGLDAYERSKSVSLVSAVNLAEMRLRVCSSFDVSDEPIAKRYICVTTQSANCLLPTIRLANSEAPVKEPSTSVPLRSPLVST